MMEGTMTPLLDGGVVVDAAIMIRVIRPSPGPMATRSPAATAAARMILPTRLQGSWEPLALAPSHHGRLFSRLPAFRRPLARSAPARTGQSAGQVTSASLTGPSQPGARQEAAPGRAR
jgi:hypothetical protein